MSSQLYSSLLLDPSNAEIRTLTVLPSADCEAPIECSLNVVSLNGDCDFEALSYVWHEPSLASTPPVAILVNAVSFTPTPNLFSALKHLRRSQKARTIWADAICINQHDVNERNAQVPLMARIYTIAKAVAVWLGPSNDEIDTYASIDPMVSANTRQLQDLLSTHFGDSSDPPEPETLRNLDTLWHEVTSMLREIFGGISSLVKNKYWSRMWTYQECCLPTANRVFYSGYNSFSWEQVGYNLVKQYSYQISALSFSLNEKEKESRGDLVLFQKRLQCEVAMRNEMEAIYTAVQGQTLGSSALPRHRPQDRICGLQRALLDTRFRQCHDPLDRFYALFGMAEDSSCLPLIDYAKSVQTVSTEVATYLLLREKNAGLFDSWDYTAPTRSTSSPQPPSPVRPSWIPDFHNKVPAFQLDFWIATGSTRNNFISASKDLSTLSIHARSFGTSKVLAHFTSSTADNMAIFVDALSQIIPRLSQRSDDDMFRRSVKRLLTTMLVQQPRPELYEMFLEAPIEALVKWCSDSTQQSNESTISAQNFRPTLQIVNIWEVVKSVWNITVLGNLPQDTVLFVTEDLHLGFANAQMQDGDIVARLGNQRGSCVLRRCEAGSSQSASEETFIMVCPAAVKHLPLIWDAEEADNASMIEDPSADKTEPIVFRIR